MKSGTQPSSSSIRSVWALPVLLAGTLAFGPAIAAIENEAVATGERQGETTRSAPSNISVPVAPPSPALIVSVEGTEHADLDEDGTVSEGDELVFRAVVENTGNISLVDVTPIAGPPTFGSEPGQNETGTFVAEGEAGELQPGASASFTGRYALTLPDIYRAAGEAEGVVALISASAAFAGSDERVTAEGAVPAAFSIPAAPQLALEKTYQITSDSGVEGAADAGDVITYRYAVSNTGNVALENIAIEDVHAGEPLAAGLIVEADTPLLFDGPLANSQDSTQGDGRYDLLGPGATVVFEYRHTVTQAEFEAQ